MDEKRLIIYIVIMFAFCLIVGCKYTDLSNRSNEMVRYWEQTERDYINYDNN